MSFVFNFSETLSSKADKDIPQGTQIGSIDAGELENYAPADQASTFETIQLTQHVQVRKGLISSEQASSLLGDENVSSSDLVPGTYEGGFKLWECGVDLAKYLCDLWHLKRSKDGLLLNGSELGLKRQRALELGCGHGLPAIVAAMAGMEVHFQDYNVEVLNELTVPNCTANLGSLPGQWPSDKQPRFFFGGWSSLKHMLRSKGLSGTYDYIFSSDTIYSLDSQKDLLDCILEGLKTGGTAFIAAKAYYFGVGGSAQGFKLLASKRGNLTVTDATDIDDGTSNKREIFSLSKTW